MAWLTTSEVAERCGVCDRTVRTWIRFGELPATNIGTRKLPRYRVNEDKLWDFMRLRALSVANGNGTNCA